MEPFVSLVTPPEEPIDSSTPIAPQINSLLDRITTSVRSLWSWLNKGEELTIRQTIRAGEVLWIVYDPATRQTLYFLNQFDLVSWLDRR